MLILRSNSTFRREILRQIQKSSWNSSTASKFSSSESSKKKSTFIQSIPEEKQIFPNRRLKKEIERRIRTVQMETMIMKDLGTLNENSKLDDDESNSTVESIVSRKYLTSNASRFNDQLASIKSTDILAKNRSMDAMIIDRRTRGSKNADLPLGKFTKVGFSTNDSTTKKSKRKSTTAATGSCYESAYDRGFHVEGDRYKDEYVAGAISDLPAEKELDEDTFKVVESPNSSPSSSPSSSFTRIDRKEMLERGPYRLRFGAEDAVEEIDFVHPTQEIVDEPRRRPYRKWQAARKYDAQRAQLRLVGDDEVKRVDKLYEKRKRTLLDDRGFGEETESEEWKQYYGRADRSVRPADSSDQNQRCGGCGATFHCQDSSLPGFLPAQVFVEKRESEDFGGTICRRCYLIQRHQFLVNVSVAPVDYERVLGHLRTVEEALILLLVDMTDFPACIYPKLPELIGQGKPLIVVGNKVDLLPPDSEKGYVRHFHHVLRRTIVEMGFAEKMNLLSVEMVSAKTGYGIENLISLIFDKWKNRGDVYLIGCTNTGKSTLFNALLQSDLCKVRAVDLLERATSSLWPGTTLNLLKFPVMNPSTYRLIERRDRLRAIRSVSNAEEQHRRILLEETGDSRYMMLQGLVGRTDQFDKEEDETRDEQPINSRLADKIIERPRKFKLDEGDFAIGRWCFDTPGTVHREQLINYMTLNELIKTVPRSMIHPRTYTLGRNDTMFVGGLARVDFVQGPRSAMVTVFASEELPIYVEETDRAEELYRKYVGTAAMAVPYGDKERLAAFPSLKRRSFALIGSGLDESCADVTISSAGWITITAPLNQEVKLDVWTPGGVGMFVRKPPLLPFIVNARGARVHRTNVFENPSPHLYDRREDESDESRN